MCFRSGPKTASWSIDLVFMNINEFQVKAFDLKFTVVTSVNLMQVISQQVKQWGEFVQDEASRKY